LQEWGWTSGRNVQIDYRWAAGEERTAFQIVNFVVIVIDDGRPITLPRIIDLSRISLVWRIGVSRRVVLRRSLSSRPTTLLTARSAESAPHRRLDRQIEKMIQRLFTKATR
jgi:hypothetical protein